MPLRGLQSDVRVQSPPFFVGLLAEACIAKLSSNPVPPLFFGWKYIKTSLPQSPDAYLRPASQDDTAPVSQDATVILVG